MNVNTELRDFLRSRREALTPYAVGLPVTAQDRRVKGLRRSEVAQLAGVSAEYYARLEQGRARHASPQVLTAVATALRLDDVATRHLFTLAGATEAKPSPVRRSGQPVRPGLHQVLDAMEFAPAYIRDENLDLVAGNAMWKLVFPGLAGYAQHTDRNVLRWTLLDPGARAFYPDWERVAREMVQMLRLRAGTATDDPRITDLVRDLMLECPEFPEWWGAHEVFERTDGRKRVRHAIAGDLELDFDAFVVRADPALTMIVYSAPRGSVSEERLRMLASWGAPAPFGARDRR